MSGKQERRSVQTPPGRVSFPALIEPQGMEGAEKKFGLTLIFPPGADLKPLVELAQAAALAKWPTGKLPSGFKKPIRDVREKDIYGELPDGSKFVVFRSRQRPGVVRPDRSLIPVEALETELFAGCWARVQCHAYAYDKGGGRGVAFGLEAVQKIRDDTPFSGRVNAEAAFDAVEEGMAGDAAEADVSAFTS